MLHIFRGAPSIALDTHSFSLSQFKFNPEIFLGKNSSTLLLHVLLYNAAVFARMKPEQKALLVEHMIGMGYCTAMVGDGANDCQSLKAAEVPCFSFLHPN
jgi:hypothetical protein